MELLEEILEVPEVLVLTVVPVELGVQMKLEDAVYLQEVAEVAEKLIVDGDFWVIFHSLNPVALVLMVKLFSPTSQDTEQKFQPLLLVLISGKLVRNAPFQLR